MASALEKKVELKPVSVSINDLGSILGKLESLIKTANKDILTDSQDFTISLGHKTDTVSSNNWSDTDFFANAPEVSTDLSANYNAYLENAPIKSVRIWFYHGRRVVEIKGYDSNQVVAFTSTAKEMFKPHHAIMAGSTFNGILIFLCIVLAQALFQVKPSEKWQDALASIAGLGLTILCIYWVTADNSPFPGFVVYQKGASFVEKYGVQIGFWGSILGIIGFLLQFKDFFKKYF